MSSTHNPALGTVSVQHNGISVNHLHATTVEFENASNLDASDVVVTLSFQGIGHVISTNGSVDNTVLNLDANYLSAYNAAVGTPQLQQVNTAVVYRIPVLNRRRKAFFHMLVHRDDLSAPLIVASCNHLGYRLERRKMPAAVLLGVSQNTAIYGGLAASIPVIVLLLMESHHAIGNAVVTYILGLSVALIGALAIRLLRLLDRLFG